MTLRRLILHNFWLKVFSIAMGTVIWMSIHYSIEHDFALSEPGPGKLIGREAITVAITIVKQAGDMREFRVTPSAVVLSLQGDERVLLGTERKYIKVFVDLTSFQSRGPSVEDLHPEVPNNVHVIDFTPHTVTVEQITP